MLADLTDLARRTRWYFRTDRMFMAWSYVALAGLAFTIVTLLIGGLSMIAWLGLGFDVLAVGGWIHDWRGRAEAANSLRMVPVKKHHMVSDYDTTAAAHYADWQVMGDRGRAGFDAKHAVYHPELDRRLQADAHIELVDGGDWRALPRTTSVADRWGGRPGIENEEKIRLAVDLMPETSSVLLQRTDYNHYIATNHLAVAELRDAHNATQARFAEVGHTGGRISTLADSRCSNHLGGDVLVVAPGRFWLQVQSMKNLMFPGHWAATGGSFDWDKDLDFGLGLVDVVKAGLLRELNEEFALDESDSPRHEDVKVLGYARATYTGGKPQFYGIARVPVIRPTIREKYVEIIEEFGFQRGAGAESLLRRIDTFEREARSIAPPLKLLFRTLRRYVDESPDAEEWLTKYW